MTLEQLRIFVGVAEREHMTRAAEALNVTQSAASAAIAALEARHGVPLHLCGQIRAERWNDTVTACLHVVDAAPVPPG